MSASDSLVAALRYVAVGYAPIPLLPMAKTPVYAGLFDDPPTTAEAVERAWGRARRILGGRPPNVGLLLGASGLCMVDADTPAEVESFRALCEAHGTEMPRPTVRTPGQREGSGAWKHRDGGHTYVYTPKGISPDITFNVPLSLDGDAEGVAHLQGGRRLAVAPPSVRAEGPYVVVSGEVLDPWPWLAALIEQAAQKALRDTGFDGSISVSNAEFAWDAATDWLDVLPEGWELAQTGHDGHLVYARPGGASRRSAVAHVPGCPHFPDQSVPAPLTIQTDQPGGYLDAVLASSRRSLTKLTAYAWRWYRGDTHQARMALGLPAPTRRVATRRVGASGGRLPEMPEAPTPEPLPVPEPQPTSAVPEPPPEPEPKPTPPAPEPEHTKHTKHTEHAEPEPEAAPAPTPVRDPGAPWQAPDIADRVWQALASAANPLTPELRRMAAQVERRAGPTHWRGTPERAAEDQLITARHVTNADLAAAVGIPPRRMYAALRVLLPWLDARGIVLRERTSDPSHDPREFKSPATHPDQVTWAVFDIREYRTTTTTAAAKPATPEEEPAA